MDIDPFEQKKPRKMRFQPKAPVKRPPKTTSAKKEEIDEIESAKANELMKRLQDSLAVGKPKVEKKPEPVRVAFGYGAAIAGNSNGNNFNYQGKARSSTLKNNKEYKEPWNYYSYYPVTVPLRQPYSGNPNLLDEEEFGQTSTFDETMCNSAMELGLMEECSERRMMFLQLPPTLPAMKRAAGVAGQASVSGSKPQSGVNPVNKPCELKDLQAGAMGKLLVYKSGAVKLKLGDILYDVSPGSDSIFAQDIVAINAKDKVCCNIGELQKRAIITPDVDSILDNMADLG